MMSIPERLFSVLLLFMTILLLGQLGDAEPTQDKQALQDFLNMVPHSNRLDWNASTSVCDWVGVGCDSSRSYVSSLRLPAVGLVAVIPADTIGRLSQLRVLSLRSNGLYGQIPDDFSNLTLLRSLYLQENHFSGEFPASVTRLTRLTRLDLSSNNFSGAIPSGINNLTHLSRLYLQNNNFSGELPSIHAAGAGGSLKDFDVSNNNLKGSIPRSLWRFPESSFKGNLQLCGGPLSACNNSSSLPAVPPTPSSIVPSSPAERSHKKLSAAAIAVIAVAAAVVFLILLFCIVFCLLRRQRQQSSTSPKHPPTTTRAVGGAAGAAGGGEAGTSSSKDDHTSSAVAGERSKLVFLNVGAGGGYNFDLEDLLRASAEVLGKGSVGTSYKAVLEDGTTVVVKRLKEVTASKREFEMQMEVLGGCTHENVVPLRAYYYSKDEKLLVYDYFRAGSLSAMLHGSRGSGKTPLDWDGRMKTALGAARGLTYLHVLAKVVHGNIKASNVLLRKDYQEAALSDFGLTPLFGNSTPNNKVAGYRAPEVLETRKATFKSDVYSFGVLLLELLTGKAPNRVQANVGEEGFDLPRWVQSVVREEWTAEVFDAELMRYSNGEEEMVQLLQIAMSCVQTVPDQRPTMPEVLRMMEEISRGETDNVVRQPSDDPSRGSDGQTIPVEGTPTSSVTP